MTISLKIKSNMDSLNHTSRLSLTNRPSQILLGLVFVVASLGSLAAPSALLTVAVGEVLVDGRAARAPTTVEAGREIRVAAGAGNRAVVYFPVSGSEFEIGGGSAMIGVDGLVGSGKSPAVISKKIRSSGFKTARLDAATLVQAGGQFKAGSVTQSPDRMILLPHHILFSWPIADREGPFHLRVLDGDRVVVERTVSITRAEISDPRRFMPNQTYLWEVKWRSASGRELKAGGRFRIADAALVKEADELQIEVGTDADGQALFRAWVTSQATKDEQQSGKGGQQ